MKTKILVMLSFIAMVQVLLAQTVQYEQFQKNTMDGTKFGMRNKITGKEVIPAIYDKVVDIREGKFAVVKDGQCGVVDTANNVIVPIKYTSINNYIEGRTFVSNGQKWAMADDKGKFITQFIYDQELSYNEGMAEVSIDGKVGYINDQGASIIPCKFLEGIVCTNGLIVVYAPAWYSTGYDVVRTQNGKEVSRQNVGVSSKKPFIFNKKGAVVYNGEEGETVTILPDGGNVVVLEKYITAADKTYDKVIDNSGRVLIPYEKGYMLDLDSNWIRIKTVGQGWVYGILGFDGQILLKPNFTSISDYTYNNSTLARVAFPDGSYFYIDKKVKCVEFDNHKCPEQ